ncbi:pyridoxal phosphate-dependent aminotransferase [Kaistia dalseonensis]|uniref:aspartate transaminase n=1 Tax=Kaistia dalseonensis TaxID=410840 RepID=A0ABU0H1U4_9HYPH|nr:pyridoxal phosphate-dependent aminotransferase [Kaistia dalseonensis]MCX5493311.1 pyridoxal phosphate-dependent aminotransferase [Kaistia dalseonensis]MDQ0435868.1 aspartate/methionine/tyrosine aminotransferase [Kaistia dalseonensis]
MTRETSAFPPTARPAIGALAASRIRVIANAAMGRRDMAAFWFGESDQPTPDFITEAGIASLRRHETFYSQNLGRPALRSAIARYSSALHGISIDEGRVAAVASGDSGLMLTSQLIVSPGDRVVVVTPIWPNIAEIPKIMGADVVRHSLVIENGRWRLDVERLIEELTPDTRMLIVNSPNNPTGWTIEAEDQAALFAHCRRHGIWILSDDVYERIVFRPGLNAAPSMLSLADPEDRLIVVNSFSKAWRMTGWRVGWITAPTAIMDDLAKVIEYNTSCIPDFTQHAAIAAVSDPRSEDEVLRFRADLARSRALLVDGLRALGSVDVPEADGAMYTFFRIEGRPDCMELARGLVEKVGLGLAPGSAFGPEGDGWLRWCFAAAPEKIEDGLDRLRTFLR